DDEYVGKASKQHCNPLNEPGEGASTLICGTVGAAREAGGCPPVETEFYAGNTASFTSARAYLDRGGLVRRQSLIVKVSAPMRVPGSDSVAAEASAIRADIGSGEPPRIGQVPQKVRYRSLPGGTVLNVGRCRVW